jgi:hypothetical protein
MSDGEKILLSIYAAFLGIAMFFPDLRVWGLQMLGLVALFKYLTND